MDPKRNDANIYDFITQLVKHMLHENCSENRNSYTSLRNDTKIIKNLRSKAYEILLNKSNKVYNQGNAEDSKNDPFVEILKYAFVLKLSLRHMSEAQELENLINELYTQEDDIESVIHPTLQLLVQLKNFQTNVEAALDVFHYGKLNPSLPEDIMQTNGIQMFQTYPMESFSLSDKFEAMLGIHKTYARQDTLTNFVSGTSLENKYVSQTVLGIKAIRYNNTIEMIPPLCISNSTESTSKQCNLVTPFLTHIMVEEANQLYLLENVYAVRSEDHNHNFMNRSEHVKNNINLISKSIPFSDDYISKLRTWESFGLPESPKQSLFVTDLLEAALHLTRINETITLSLLPKKAIYYMFPKREVSPEKLLSDVKLLLFGIDSDSFKYDAVTGFKLEENICAHGISLQALRIICQEAICWGNSFKTLSHLVTSDPQTGKLQQNGLIFKAMCVNVKELLLYYRSALQRILNRHEFRGLLSLFKEIRPLAHLIVEVARLCNCDRRDRCILDGGSGILTHIYKEVTKVTNPKVALVFYSILKSCCEVYFQLLQNWLFEGTCDDVYGEFMIQVRSHYLRKRGRKFWTECFAIDAESVPGFLSELSESILQCGKTLRLLKICSPQNPVCNVSFNVQPEVKVCLSVSMLREQLLRCQEYERKGKAALGPIVSLLSVIQDEKKTERETAELVIRAQQETLSRLNRQREELIMKARQSKRELLQELKQQAEESALFKEKEKEIELLADKLLLEKINREEEEKREQQRIEKEHLVNYYDKLTADIRLNNTLETNEMTERIIGTINRPKSLAIERIDNMTAAQTNKLKVLMQEYGITPNNNEFSTILANKREINDCTNVDNTNKQSSDNMKENVNNNILSTPDIIKLPKETTIMDESTSNEECPSKANNVNNEIQKSSNNQVFVNVPNEPSSNNTKENMNNNILSKRDQTIELPEETATMDELTNNEICSNETNNIDDKVQESTSSSEECANKANANDKGQESISSNVQQNVDTPMSCTTDNYTTFSAYTPSSQMLNSDDMFANTDQEASTSYDTAKSIIEEASYESPMSNDFKLPNFFGASPDVKSIVPSSLTIADVEMIDHTSLQVYLEKSIIIPLQIQTRLVNDAIIKYLVNECNMLSHLRSLRSYFFLLNGEFAKSLTDSLYSRLYAISAPIELFNSATLTNLLEKALMNSFSNNYANSELLSLSAVDKPCQLYISDPNVLECLCLNYKISWPLNIVLDDTIMLQYSKVFKFLIMTGRMSWVLQEDFNIMKMERNSVISEQYHKLQLYRHSMTQFMNALHNYLTCSVLHASWSEFEKDLQNSRTIDQIYLSHMNYIKRILSRCMLNTRGEKMRVCLINIFKIILKFHNRLRSQAWNVGSTGQYSHLNFKSLEQMYRSFCEWRTYMAHVAHKLATSGYQPHLMHFLNALNINHMYNLTAKRQ